jgi:tRNA (Thr-GGU) A37 N-methylase
VVAGAGTGCVKVLALGKGEALNDPLAFFAHVAVLDWMHKTNRKVLKSTTDVLRTHAG